MGATPLQHRVAVGCYAAKLSSSKWNYSSTGKISERKAVSVSCPSRGRLLVLLLKLAAITTPIILILGSNGHSLKIAPPCLANNNLVTTDSAFHISTLSTYAYKKDKKGTKSVLDNVKSDHRKVGAVQNKRGRKDSDLTATSLRQDMPICLWVPSVRMDPDIRCATMLASGRKFTDLSLESLALSGSSRVLPTYTQNITVDNIIDIQFKKRLDMQRVWLDSELEVDVKFEMFGSQETAAHKINAFTCEVSE